MSHTDSESRRMLPARLCPEESEGASLLHPALNAPENSS